MSSRRQLLCCCRVVAQRRTYATLPPNLSLFQKELDMHPDLYAEWNDPSRPHDPKIFIYNDPPIYAGRQGPPAHAFPDTGGSAQISTRIAASTPYDARDIRHLYRFALVTHRTATMTSKGKLPSMYALVVTGNGKGLLGWGQGKHDMLPRAIDKAFAQAVRNMGVVERFEDRTVWGSLEGKFGATNLSMWARPPGFGLRTSPLINQIAKAAGIRDLSAKIRGSRNPMNTVKLAVGMLQNKSRPVAFGDGFGHRGQRKEKIDGMRTAMDVAFARGRRAALI